MYTYISSVRNKKYRTCKCAINKKYRALVFIKHPKLSANTFMRL